MKIFKMIRGFLLKRSRSYKVMQNVIFHVKLLSPTLTKFHREFLNSGGSSVGKALEQ